MTVRITLVGAGPGAADLLTLRAVRAIEAAEVVLIDALVSDEVRSLIPPGARIIEVGKRGHKPSAGQDFINRTLVRYAQQGFNVVRLKGGDPSIFGRAAEERAALEAMGIEVAVVPGITSASAAAAQFRISLTERGTARRVLFATGHRAEGPETDWESAADPATTVCLYMAAHDFAAIAAALIAAGRRADTPAIAVCDVERPAARMLAATLATLAARLAADAFEGPVVILVGDVCRRAVSSPCAPHFREGERRVSLPGLL
ncbi:uroporphyrin-III C-methyltransferase [Hyphomonas neptunium ATCC 15444]|uniref:uroporphyrinogen-III C-methyltransferase n=2 Tax=Hyphomonas TaxID=85 RepID=Q0C017_HYPNA|nr:MULTISPECIES: uroporphyrinogen-III C-methyltransferase [Hyphomonas]ABI78254.1 uroporphyrin-III C-methyltransferase [Hyphomonas neptunium ATCC 15444]KCZ86615.1 uroporphyrin-III C-methyltransferase [Hyphomonas hirschiana VP5]